MLHTSETMEQQAVLQMAAKMCAAARTAPKGRGKDTLHAIGKTTAEMGYGENIVWLGIPLSVSGKNIFFDCGIFHD